jgi:predicted RNase H-like nuclease (RuvC/YqgF family)
VRQRNMLVVEDGIASNRRRLTEFKARKQELASESATLEQQGKSLAVAKQRELKSLDEQIPGLEATIYQKRRDMEALRVRYDDDLKRYRELKGNGQSASSQ